MTRHPRMGTAERRTAFSVNLHRIVQLRSASNYRESDSPIVNIYPACVLVRLATHRSYLTGL
jgi:hypothetical protein